MIGVLEMIAELFRRNKWHLGNLGRRENNSLLEHANGLGLDLLSGREGPARSAVSLVLDGGGVLASPVNQAKVGLGGRKISHDRGRVGLLGDIGVKVSLLEILLRDIRELGDAVDGSSVVLAFKHVALVSDLQVFDKILESCRLGLDGFVLSVVVADKTIESIALMEI